jgi:hypothetical protein
MRWELSAAQREPDGAYRGHNWIRQRLIVETIEVKRRSKPRRVRESSAGRSSRWTFEMGSDSEQ